MRLRSPIARSQCSLQKYLESSFTQPEWAAAFAQDPQGKKQKLVPIRIAACELTGLLAPIVYLDFVGFLKTTPAQLCWVPSVYAINQPRLLRFLAAQRRKSQEVLSRNRFRQRAKRLRLRLPRAWKTLSPAHSTLVKHPSYRSTRGSRLYAN